MKVTEEYIRDNIKPLYLKALDKHPNITRTEIPLIICKELDITDDNIIAAVKSNCILAGYYLFTNGYVKKEYNHSAYKSIALMSLSEKGKEYLNKKDNKGQSPVRFGEENKL